MLITKSVFAEPFASDGVRIHTAGRETLDDGKTEHPLLQVGIGYDLWWPELAPDGSVYWSLHEGRIDWPKFEDLYLEKLRSDGEALVRMAELAGMEARGNVTALCLEQQPHHCHRRLLAEEMKRRFPGINILVR